MDWTLEAIDSFLKSTFDDQRLSRSEKKALKELVDATPEMRVRVRRRAFAMAKGFADDKGVDAMLEWLEEVEKALFEVPSTSPANEGPEVWFSPHQQIFTRIIGALDKAVTRADLAVFTITDDRITRAIIGAHKRGVAVRIVSDNDKSSDPGSDIEQMARIGIPVRIDRTMAHMHHKFAVVDRSTLINGSYNWTRSAANENHENIVIDTDPQLVVAFEREFELCWSLAEDY